MKLEKTSTNVAAKIAPKSFVFVIVKENGITIFRHDLYRMQSLYEKSVIIFRDILFNKLILCEDFYYEKV